MYKVYGLTEFDGAYPIEPEFCGSLEEAMQAATEILDDCYIDNNVRETSCVSSSVDDEDADITMWVEGSNHGESISLRIRKAGEDLEEAEKKALERWCTRMRWRLAEDGTRYKALAGATAESVMATVLHVEDSWEESGRALWNPAAGKALTWMSVAEGNYTVWSPEMPLERALELSAASADGGLPWLGLVAVAPGTPAYRMDSAEAESQEAELRGIVSDGLERGPWVLCAWGPEAERLEELGGKPLSDMLVELDLYPKPEGEPRGVLLRITDADGELTALAAFTCEASVKEPAKAMIAAAASDAVHDESWKTGPGSTGAYTWERLATACSDYALENAGLRRCEVPALEEGCEVVTRYGEVPIVTTPTAE